MNTGCIAVSLPVHEAPEVVLDQCLNLRVVGGIDHVVVHVNRNAIDFDTERLSRDAQAHPLLRDRVHLNPVRLATEWVAPGLLHRAHLANFRYAQERLGPAIFCMDGSNTLLVRPGLADFMRKQGLGIDAVSPFGWGNNWEQALRDDSVLQQHGGALCRRSQIEGVFMPSELMAEVVQWIDGYDADFDQRWPDPTGAPALPREEYLFATALLALGYQARGTAYVLHRHGGNHVVYRFDAEGKANATFTTSIGHDFHFDAGEIAMSLAAGQLRPFFWELLADHVPPILDTDTYRRGKFGIKRVNRVLDEPIRAMVRAHYGY